MNIFQPIVRISYHGGSQERAGIVTYSIDGKPHTNAPKELDVDQIPVLLFQLVERGYNVFLDPRFPTMGRLNAKSILAFSKEYHDRLQAKMDAQTLAMLHESPAID